MVSLVLSLLILSVVLALMINEVAKLATNKLDIKASAVVEKEVIKPSSVETNKMSIKSKQRFMLQKSAPIIEIVFEGDVCHLDTFSKKKLRSYFPKIQKNTKNGWKVWLETDTNDIVKRRLGYLRVMTVRNELFELGVPGEMIIVKLKNVLNTSVEAQQTVHLTHSFSKDEQ